MFVDRVDAGMQLAEALEGFRGSDAVLLAIPRGGVPEAAVVAQVSDEEVLTLLRTFADDRLKP